MGNALVSGGKRSGEATVPGHREHGATRVGRSTSFTWKGKWKCSAGVGGEQQGNGVLLDIAGEAVQDRFEVILGKLLPLL